ncbi:MAG: restriction endonuclease subunit S [Clostridia bacterium]|nr:restriction endonuclease subunit S [Clostridia bacterium]
MEKRVINICDVCEEIFAGGDAPKDRFSETKTDDFSVPIYSNGEANSGLYGYTNFSRVNVPSITVSARGTIGYTTIRHEPFVPIVRLITLVPKTDVIDINYLYYATQNYKFVNNGTSIPQLTVPMLKRYSFPLPSMEQQKKIADEFDKVTVLIDKRKKQLEKLDELVKARFVELFGDINANDREWNVQSLGELCTIVRGGSPRPIEKYLGGDIPWIKIGDATDGESIYLHSTKEHIVQAGVSKSRMVKSGSLIFANCGVSLGFARIITFDGCIHDGWLAMEDIDERLNKVFLLQSLNQMTEHFRRIAPAGTQPNLNTAIMKAYKQIVPPLELQKEFIAFVEQVDKSKFEIKQSLEKLESLKKALMQKYFG